MQSQESVKVSGVKVPFKKSFIRWNLSALLATASDFSVLSVTHYIFEIFYPYATAMGAFTGACIAFFLGRNWSFMNKEGKISHQGLKFLFTATMSMILNTSGVAFFIELGGVNNVIIAKIITASMIGICFNFPMQRYFVYK